MLGCNAHTPVRKGNTQCTATQTPGQRFLRELPSSTRKSIYVTTCALQRQVGSYALLTALQTFERHFTSGCCKTCCSTLPDTFGQRLLNRTGLRTHTPGQDFFSTGRSGHNAKTCAQQNLIEVVTHVFLSSGSRSLRLLWGLAFFGLSAKDCFVDVLFYRASTLCAADCASHSHDSPGTQSKLGKRQRDHHRSKRAQRRSRSLQRSFEDVEQTCFNFLPCGAGLFGLLHALSLRLQFSFTACAQTFL